MGYLPPGQGRYGDPKVGEGEEYELRAPGDPVYNLEDEREAQIVGWRAECFERLGFLQVVALAMATRKDVDRERVKNLIAAGATPTQVADIVL